MSVTPKAKEEQEANTALIIRATRGYWKKKKSSDNVAFPPCSQALKIGRETLRAKDDAN